MKANELRIGNYIFISILQNDGSFKDELFTVNSTVMRDAEHYGKEWNATPIPLTEGWLLKFGIIFKGYDDDGDRIFSDGNEPWFEKLDGGFYLQEYGREIKYVHQLQNLYFALTGNELTIKL